LSRGNGESRPFFKVDNAFIRANKVIVMGEEDRRRKHGRDDVRGAEDFGRGRCDRRDVRGAEDFGRGRCGRRDVRGAEDRGRHRGRCCWW